MRFSDEGDVAVAMPLVVGVDGSEASLQAVEWAADEAVLHEVPLHLVHVVSTRGEAFEFTVACERGRRRAGTVRLSSEVVHEDVASALIGRGRNAFALVLGSRGLGDLAGLLLGSVSLAVAARADCPVVVVRREERPSATRYGSVVVGVEDGEGSGTAVRFAFREARVRRCRLVAVHAWSDPLGTPAGPFPLPGHASVAHRAAQVIDDALHGLAERYPGPSVSRRAVEGPARQALLEASAEADLLVVGARRRHGHPGLQLGLTNHAVLHHAPCPVAVVPQI